MATRSVHIAMTIGVGEIVAPPAHISVDVSVAYEVEGDTSILPKPTRYYLKNGEVTIEGLEDTYLGADLVWLFVIIYHDRRGNETQLERTTKTFPAGVGAVEYTDMVDVETPAPDAVYGPSYLAQTLAYRNEAEGFASAAAATLANVVPLTQKGAASGVATLDSGTKIPVAQIPDAVKAKNGNRPVGRGEWFFDPTDYGDSVSPGYVVGSGGDDSAAFQACFNAAATYGGTVLMPRGYFRAVNLTVTSHVIMESVGSHSDLGPAMPSGGYGSSILGRPTGDASGNPIITLTGTGSGLRNILLDGRGYTGTGLVVQAIEPILEHVRTINCLGIGIDFQRVNNPYFFALAADWCGTSTLPAVKIWSRDKSAFNPSSTNETNTVDFFGLKIERPRNAALEIAYGTTAEYWAEWIRIYGLHIESSYLNTPNLTGRLVRIGNVRCVEFFSPWIYCGPGGAIEHNQTVTRSYLNGGIRLYGGTILGPDLTITTDGLGNPVTPVAPAAGIYLLNGTDFLIHGTQFARLGTVQMISASSTYGAYDYKNTRVDGGYKMEPSPTIGAYASGAQNAAFGAGSDQYRGRIFFGTGATVAAGILLQINRYHNDGRDFTIMLSAKSSATAALQLYSAVSGDKSAWTIRSAVAPLASQGNTVYQVEYEIVYL